MPATLLSMSQDVAGDAGLSGSINAVSAVTGDQARVVRYVRDAAQYVENLWGDWRFLWGGLLTGVTAAGGSVIAAPVNHYRWDRDRMFFDDHLICPILWNDFHPWSGMNDPGYPTHFVIMPDSSVQMFPPPDQSYAYNFSWYQESGRLEGNEDEPRMPDRFRCVIKARALWLYAMYDDSAELAAKADAEYNTWMALLEADQRPGGYPSNQSHGNHLAIRAE